MHLAIFGSGSGTILRAVLAAQKEKDFRVKVLYTDRLCNFQKIAAEENLPLIDHRYDPSLKREEYDREGLALLSAFSKTCPIDCILLAGYMRLLSPVWLNAYPNKILNIHPADLTTRKYIGANAVFDALQNGETKTRSTAILINEEVDGGPIIALGPWVLYEEGYPVTKEKAARHQEKQKRLSDWPVTIQALETIGKKRCAESLGF